MTKFSRLVVLSLVLTAPSLVSAQPEFARDNKNKLPQIGIAGAEALSVEKERIYGDFMMRQLRAASPLVGDPVLEQYVQDLGNRLVNVADDVNYPFEFFIINDKEINAFAFFGGHVGIHTGLIDNADTESQLASVIGHEIAHVTQRHIARKMAEQQKQSPLSLAGMLGGLVLAMINPEVGMAAIQTSQAASMQSGINFTRGMEKEADRIGLRIMSNAGFDARGASEFFAKLAEKYRIKAKPPAFLLTHPLPESRIADVRSRVNNMPTRFVEESLDFHLAKARVQARYTYDGKAALAHFTRQLTDDDFVFLEAAEYGLALAYYGTQEYSKALSVIEKLRTQKPDNFFYLDTWVDINLGLKNYDVTIRTLKAKLAQFPRNGVITLNLANALIESGNTTESITLLKDFLLLNASSTIAYDLLSNAYAKEKNYLRMHESKAEWFALLAAYNKSVEELNNAKGYTLENPVAKRRIVARIEQLKDAERQMKEL